AERGGRVVLATPPLEQTAIDDIVRQRVLEAVHELGIVSSREDEIQAVEILEVADHLVGGAPDHTAHERGAEAAPYHRPALQRELELICQPVNAGGEDGVDGSPHVDVAAAEPGFTG